MGYRRVPDVKERWTTGAIIARENHQISLLAVDSINVTVIQYITCNGMDLFFFF